MNKSQSAYAVLRQRILTGSYSPGQRLVLSELAKELGVSTVPIREALRLLEAEGWVVFRPNVGVEIRPAAALDWVHIMATLAVTEGHATALAAEHLTSEDIARARGENDKILAALERLDPRSAVQSTREFHRILCDACPNRYLLSVVTQATERIEAMRHSVYERTPARTRESMQEHETLLRLIESRAEHSVIENYAREHKARTITAYLAERDGLAN